MATKVRGGSNRYYLRAKGVCAEPVSSPESNSTENSSSQGNRCDKPSYSEDGDVCNISESSRHKYASFALAKFNVTKKNIYESCDVPRKSYDFVEVGPISAGYFRGRPIFHFNFKAKDKDDASADVETFFSEVTLNKHNSIIVDNVYRLAPSHSLPEKANTYGCLYCLSRNIHHPKFRYGFRTGRGHHLKYMVSKIANIDKYIKKGKRKRKFLPKFSDSGVHYSGDMSLDPADFIAKVALRKFDAHEGTNYELVNVGPCQAILNKYGYVMHMNFEAKTKDDPEVETFFAEVVIQQLYFFVAFCKCLGSSSSLSLKNEVDRCGCFYCQVVPIHHPPGPGYLTGRPL